MCQNAFITGVLLFECVIAATPVLCVRMLLLQGCPYFNSGICSFVSQKERGGDIFSDGGEGGEGGDGGEGASRKRRRSRKKGEEKSRNRKRRRREAKEKSERRTKRFVR